MSSSQLVIDLSSYTFDELDEENKSADDDFMLALQLQMQMEDDEENPNDISQKELVSKKPSRVESLVVDPEWDLIDPCPDIRALFQEYDKKYFWSRLGSCIVEWSKRMTICAGIFYLREGGIIRLSEPLLKFRPRADLIDTLLHEMIHAYLYLTRNFKDRGDHGDEFKGHAARINKLANSRITVYHSFHDEVNNCRQHVWRCTGTCSKLAPFYGYVKRSMNRAPGKNDTWWSQHESKCAGSFVKISEPEVFKQKQEDKKAKKEAKENKLSQHQQTPAASTHSLAKFKTLDSFFTSKSGSILTQTNKSSSSSSRDADKPKSKLAKLDSFFASKTAPIKVEQDDDVIVCLDDSPLKRKTPSAASSLIPKKELIILNDDENDQNLSECPMCFVRLSQSLIHSHVNSHF